MNILIPVDTNDIQNAEISLMDNLAFWLLIDVTEGKIIKSNFYTNKNDIKEFIDLVIVKNQNEYAWSFMEENIAVLMAPFQNTIDDILEAYLFKELHDYNVKF